MDHLRQLSLYLQPTNAAAIQHANLTCKETHMNGDTLTNTLFKIESRFFIKSFLSC